MSDDPASAEAFRWELEQAIERLKKTRDALTEERDELVRISNKLIRERDEAWLEKGRIMNEIDCRIEHGADSNGHLEATRKLFSKQALEKMTRLDEEMGLL